MLPSLLLGCAMKKLDPDEMWKHLWEQQAARLEQEIMESVDIPEMDVDDVTKREKRAHDVSGGADMRLAMQSKSGSQNLKK